MAKGIVTPDDFQQLFHGFFVVIVRHCDRAQPITRLDVVGIFSNAEGARRTRWRDG